MRFRMLGPLEAYTEQGPVLLAGVRQRGTLGFLLLHANRVVATSKLVHALWQGDTPSSARKILQNAVWGLRATLAPDTGSDSPALVTQAPGYMLRVDPDDVDLHRFHRLAADGRARLARGEPAEASRVLRDALALWRGPVLADLVETGIAWPEVAVAQNARLDALEDFFDAEMACGRHQEVLPEVETFVQTEALRERSSGQLMLALYRCGRQADALSVYARVRTRLIEDLGLEPGRELQALQRAILTHDPSLARPVAPAPEIIAPRAPSSPQQRPEGKRRNVSVIVVRTQLQPDFEHVGIDDIDDTFECIAATIREEVERRGGEMVASFGSVSVAVFGSSSSTAVDAERAVSAATAIRDRLSMSAIIAARTMPAVRGLTVHAAVATGAVRVQDSGGDGPVMVNGALMDQCQSLLSLVPAGKIWVCERTREITESMITYYRVSEWSPGWQVGSVHPERPGVDQLPIIDREYELDLLCGMLNRVTARTRCHVGTVYGEPGVGKTRLLREFERVVRGRDDEVRFVMSRVSGGSGDRLAELAADLVCRLCGISGTAEPEVARTRLAAAVQEVAADLAETQAVIAALGSLLGDEPKLADRRVATALRVFLVRLAERGPLVVVVDDLHEADTATLDALRALAEAADGVPLLLVAAARPELSVTEWGAGPRHAATMTLEPICEDTIQRVTESLLSTVDSQLTWLAGAFCGNMLDDPDGRDAARREYVRMLLPASHG